MREFKGKNSNFVAMNLSFYRVFFPLFILLFNLLIPINAEEQQIMPLPTVAYGKIVRFTDFPSVFVKSRTIDVLLPSGYSPKKSYPVLYMHDGQMLLMIPVLGIIKNGVWMKHCWSMQIHCNLAS